MAGSVSNTGGNSRTNSAIHTQSSGNSNSVSDNFAVPSSTLFQSREEAKKARELDEARKLGIAPAEKDEEGKDINPHIPQYISKAPWYLNQTCPSLKHQKKKENKGFPCGDNRPLLEDMNSIIRKKEALKSELLSGQIKKLKSLISFKNNCANCGARTHETKFCIERPRLRKAKYTLENICPDEYLMTPEEQNFRIGSYDSKRDRWFGYSNDQYKLIIRQYELAELERKKRKAVQIQKLILGAKSKKKKRKLCNKLKKLNENPTDNIDERSDASSVADDTSDSDSDSDTSDMEDSGDEDSRIREFDLTSAPMGSKDENTRTTTRNLRIREDTAKYLYNLDVNSAFYDPKTRSMRANPFEKKNNPCKISNGADGIFMYSGDNAVRESGDAIGIKKMELFAWDAYTHGANVHYTAQPTQLELTYSDYNKKKAQLESEANAVLLDKYNGNEHLNAPKEIICLETYQYIEYSIDGKIIKERERVLMKSKYEEDVYLGNHTSVWGSYYDKETNKWGYKCCKNTFKGAECIPLLE